MMKACLSQLRRVFKPFNSIMQVTDDSFLLSPRFSFLIALSVRISKVMLQ